MAHPSTRNRNGAQGQTYYVYIAFCQSLDSKASASVRERKVNNGTKQVQLWVLEKFHYKHERSGDLTSL